MVAACASVAAMAMFIGLAFSYLRKVRQHPYIRRRYGPIRPTLSPADPGLPLATDNATRIEHVIEPDDDKPTETPYTAQPTIRRVSTAGDGWASGALRDYPQESSFADRVCAAWQKAGRPGTPRLMTSVNFAFGDQDTISSGHSHLHDYYGGFSSDYAELNVADMLTSPADAVATVRAYQDLGFDMLLLHPTVARLDQIDRLADALL